MSNKISRITSSLYWRISLMLLGVLSLLTLAYGILTVDTVKMYFMETNHKLNHDVAAHIAAEAPLFKEGQLQMEVAEHHFHNVMVLNPSLEVYLLDTTGQVLAFFAPEEKIKQHQINLQPIQGFIADPEAKMCMGQDPRHPGEYKAFSAAAVQENGKLAGYIYVILGGDAYISVSQLVANSYWLQIAARSALWLFGGALLVSLLLLYFLTRNFRKISEAVRRFQQGDATARVQLKGRGELSRLADNIDDMADTIVEQMEEVKSVERLRRELIANVSHDLRTPLAAIQGYAETLLMKHDSLEEDKRRRFTQTILTGTERMKRLVEQLFELSKLETQQVKVEAEHFNLPELVTDVVAKYELIAREKGINLKTDIPQQLPTTYADIALIDRVLQNLIDNALKYTPAGGEILISLKPERTGVSVRIADSGLGIPENDLPYIFERYRKGSAEGNGLGLAIVKKILELHQSIIRVESRLNEGTAFQFELPVG